MNASLPEGPSEWLELIERDIGTSRQVRHEAGSRIHLDPDANEVLCVRSGRVLASVLDEDGQYVVSLLRGPGDVVGIERLRGDALPYDVFMVTETEATVVDAGELGGWAKRDARHAELLLRKSLDAMALCIDERLSLRGTALQRAARFMVAAAGLATRGHRATVNHVALQLPKTMIAKALQMRPETLSRALRSLESEGAISTSGPTRVEDESTLLRLAGR